MTFLSTIVSIMFFSSLSFAAPELASIHSKRLDEGFITKLSFSAPIKENAVDVKYINQTIQVDVKGVNFSDKENLLRVDDKYVKSVYTYQVKPKIVRFRVIYKKPMKVVDLKDRVHLNIDKKTLSLAIREQVMISSVPPIGVDGVIGRKEKADADDLIYKKAAETNTTETPKTNALGIVEKELGVEFKKQEELPIREAPSSEENKKDLSESEIPLFTKKSKASIKSGDSFSKMLISLGVVGIAAIGFLLLVKWWSKNFRKNELDTKIRVLTQHHLGPKKNLSIIRVAGESLLIGVTDQNINLIKSLSFIDDEVETDVSNDFSASLGKANQNVELDFKLKDKVSFRENFKENIKNKDTTELKDVTKMVAKKLKQMRSI